MLESLYDAVIVIDKESTIVYVNRAYTTQFGVPAQKIIGRNLRCGNAIVQNGSKHIQ
ncbi:MAG: PAS domain-containing protein [Bacillota bacterium]